MFGDSDIGLYDTGNFEKSSVTSASWLFSSSQQQHQQQPQLEIVRAQKEDSDGDSQPLDGTGNSTIAALVKSGNSGFLNSFGGDQFFEQDSTSIIHHSHPHDAPSRRLIKQTPHTTTTEQQQQSTRQLQQQNQSSCYQSGNDNAVFGIVDYFNDGKPLTAGEYSLKYVDGCMKFDDQQRWTVNALDDMFRWWLVSADGAGPSKTDTGIKLPGNIGFGKWNSFNTFEDCVQKSLLYNNNPTETFIIQSDTVLGVWLDDTTYTDNDGSIGNLGNIPGIDGRSPRWEICVVDAYVPGSSPTISLTSTPEPTFVPTTPNICSFGTAGGPESSIRGSVDMFNDGLDLPVGAYRLDYIDGCFRYDENDDGYAVNSNDDNNRWWLVNSAQYPNKTSPGIKLPGIISSQTNSGGYDTYDECVVTNKQDAIRVLFDIVNTSTPLGVYLEDRGGYGDNIPGITNPTWELTILQNCNTL